MPAIHANDFGGAARQQNMGETARRGARVKTHASGGIEAESVERGGKLNAAARHPRIGGGGFYLGPWRDWLGGFADDFPIGPHKTGRDRFLRLGSAWKELAFDKRNIGAR